MKDSILVSIEMRFVTPDDPEQLADRIRESVSTIVGSRELEDFRWRALPLEPPAERRTAG